MGRRPQYDALDTLTPREREVLELLRLGLSDAQIAERLDISRAGASYHVSQIISKLGVRNRHEAASWPAAPPWWLAGVAPLAAFSKRTLQAFPAKSSGLALGAAGATTLAAIAGLTVVGFLLARSGGAADAGNNGPPSLHTRSPWWDANTFWTSTENPARPPATQVTKPPVANSGEQPPSGGGASVPESPSIHPGATPQPAKPTPTAKDILPSPMPPPVGTPHPNCAAFQPQQGLNFVTFRAGVSIERAQEIVASLGAQWSIYQEANMQPMALPIPDPGPDGYVRMVLVPAGEEAAYAAAFEKQPEVVRAQLDWPLCDDFR